MNFSFLGTRFFQFSRLSLASLVHHEAANRELFHTGGVSGRVVAFGDLGEDGCGGCFFDLFLALLGRVCVGSWVFEVGVGLANGTLMLGEAVL